MRKWTRCMRKWNDAWKSETDSAFDTLWGASWGPWNYEIPRRVHLMIIQTRVLFTTSRCQGLQNKVSFLGANTTLQSWSGVEARLIQHSDHRKLDTAHTMVPCCLELSFGCVPVTTSLIFLYTALFMSTHHLETACWILLNSSGFSSSVFIISLNSSALSAWSHGGSTSKYG